MFGNDAVVFVSEQGKRVSVKLSFLYSKNIIMAQYVMSMLHVSKIVPPKKTIIKDISLSFFPGAKIGLLGLNGSGKSTVLRIMAGVDKEFEGEGEDARIHQDHNELNH